MIIEQHYDDEVLIELLEEADEDKHVPVCDTCTGTLESFRDLAGALHDDSVWDERELSETPKPETKNLLRAFAATTRAEDAAAGLIVAKLLADPSVIEKNPQWRTAGVVRRLLKVVDDKNFSEPKVAADLAKLAVEVAESLDATRYPFDTATKLRATAWRERAFALCYIGSFPESVIALDAADSRLSQCAVSEYDSARVQLVRALVYRELERLPEAAALTRAAKSVFLAHGDRRRAAIAEATQSALLMQMRRFGEALPIELGIASDLSLDEEARACAMGSAAYCYGEMSLFEDGKRLYAQAISSFERLGLMSRRAVARWGLARILADEGRHEPALSLLNELRAEFEELGMAEDVALASLDSADALLALNRRAEVADLCRAAIEYFGKAGLAYSEPAMTALAYLREAAEQGTLTPATVGRVRSYFEVLPKQPNLLFAFPA